MVEFAKIIGFILISQLAGLVGGFFTSQSVGAWYQTLSKPAFNPPGWVFGPVWITLYALMGIASYLVWKKYTGPGPNFALYLFFVHLAFNALWSFLFFGLENPFLAFVDIIVLWLMIAALTFFFWKISKPAAVLLIPYLAWVSFAGILNYFIWRLN